MMSVRVLNDKDDQPLIINKEVRFVMLAKVRNSSMIFSYPVLLKIGDGKI